jgi:hypothetical protein
MFYLDTLKVDFGVAHVAMAIYACFKCFIIFQTYIANVLSRCFKSRSSVAYIFLL